MATKVIKQDNLSWINIDQVDEAALAYLKENYNFHHLDLEDIQSESQMPKMDVYKNYLFLVLQFPHWNNQTKQVVPIELDIFLGENFLITVQHDKSKEMKDFFYRCIKNKKTKKDWMSSSTGYLLYKLLDSLLRNSRPILNNIGRNISAVENTIFSGSQNTDNIRDLAQHRRNIMNFRRIIDPQRYLVANLSNTRRLFLDENMSLYFDDIVDYINNLWAISETYRDTVNGLHITVESLINQRTNKVIGALTVISVSLLPLTLLSGIYGMNIPLPFAEQPYFVWSIFFIMAVLILGLIFVMKKRKWL